MSAGILLPSEMLIWTWAYPNARTTGSGAMQLSLAESRDPSASNAMAPTNQKITTNSDGVVRWMKRQTPLNSRQRRENHIHTRSSAQTVGRTTKPIQTNVSFEGTDSTESSSKRNTLRSVKTRSSQFVLWRVANTNNDSTKTQNILTKCLQELSHHQYHT